MATSVFILLSIIGAALSHPQYSGAPAEQVHQQSSAPQYTTCTSGFDCVSWQRCSNGFITPLDGVLQTSKPSNFAELQCGLDTMCCGFPDDLLGLLEPVIGEGSLPQIEENSYQPPSSCGHISYDCVPYFQCENGVIITDGEGLIDVRVRPQGQCVNPEYPDVPAVCCLKPDAYATPEPIEKCPGYQECVDFPLCSADGTINTDGGGLIDIRTGFTSCYLPNGVGGICCTPPAPYVDSCPGHSVCTSKNQCNGQALDAASNFIDYTQTGLWSECTYGSGLGVCCLSPLLNSCPGKSVCSLGNECSGKEALDFSNNFIDYSQTGQWSHCAYGSDRGVCCRSKILDTCPGESVCLEHHACQGQALDHVGSFVDYSQQGSWSHCSTYDGGVCCISSKPTPDYRASDQCGVRNYAIDERITSNYEPNEAAFGEFPWQTIIFHQNYTFVCGASLISDRHVLTAAHCVKKLVAGDIRLRFGEWQVNDFNEPLAYIDRNVKQIYSHADFNPKNLHNDIAILELHEPLSFQYHINTVCLPDFGRTFDPNYPCFATGWGKDAFTGNYQHILKKIDLPYVHHGVCQNLLRKTILGKYFKLDDSFVCAGGEENKDACYGDGGGPLICKDPKTSQYLQVGITAWGIGCGTKDVPGVYVDVQAFKGWIDEIVFGKGSVQAVPGYGK